MIIGAILRIVTLKLEDTDFMESVTESEIKYSPTWLAKVGETIILKGSTTVNIPPGID